MPLCRCGTTPSPWCSALSAGTGKSIGSRWRKFNPGPQALQKRLELRKGETFVELVTGFGVGTATAWRYVEETVALLAARAPKLRTAVREAKKAGFGYVVLHVP